MPPEPTPIDLFRHRVRRERDLLRRGPTPKRAPRVSPPASRVPPQTEPRTPPDEPPPAA